MCAGLKGTVLNMQLIVIKGIVHPKIIISDTTHSHVLISVMCWTQKKILWKTYYVSHWEPATGFPRSSK